MESVQSCGYHKSTIFNVPVLVLTNNCKKLCLPSLPQILMKHNKSMMHKLGRGKCADQRQCACQPESTNQCELIKVTKVMKIAFSTSNHIVKEEPTFRRVGMF